MQLIRTQKQFSQQHSEQENIKEQKEIVRANSAIRQTIKEQKHLVKEAKNSSLERMEFSGQKNGKEIIIFASKKRNSKVNDLLILGEDDNFQVDGYNCRNPQIIKIMPQSTKSSQKNLSRNGSKGERKTDSVKLRKQKQQEDIYNGEVGMQRDDSKTRLQGTRQENRQQHQQNKQLDSFIKCQQLVQKGDSKQRKDREIIQTFLKRNNCEEDTIVFILNSRDAYIRRAAFRRGWQENTVQNSVIFDIKFEYTDKQNEYNNLRNSQFYNHFPDGREVTTKQGLNKNLNNINNYEHDIYKFYPRCYDLSDMKQIDQFNDDFRQSSIFSLIKKHAKLFKQVMKDEIVSIYKEDTQILDNVFKMENKKKLKRKYWNQFPSSEQMVNLGLINVSLLQSALFYAKNILNDVNENCEGDEFIKKNFYVPRYYINQRVMELMVMYAQLKLPSIYLGEPHRILQYVNGWDTPNKYLMFITLKVHRMLKKSVHQYQAIDGQNNVWICKPSYNARGFGIYCFNNINDLQGGNIRKNPTPKIVQKYIEKPLLINVNQQDPEDLRKFDIRQWVLVTSYDPLRIYVYQNAYLRVCGSAFDINEINDPLRHISNYTIQKKQDGATPQELTINIEEFIKILQKSSKYKTIQWDHFSKQIQKIVEITIKQASENIEQKNNCFELYGFDFVIDKSLNCWLIEVNMSPACAERTPWLTEMLDDMADGMLNILEKQILMNSPPGTYGGYLGQLQEDYKTNRVKVDMKKWKFIGKQVVEKKSKIGVLGSPIKNNQQQMTVMLNQTKSSMFQFDIIGSKISLKQEKKLDKQYKQYQAILFIQKFWRGYQVRHQLFLSKMQEQLRKHKIKHELSNLFDILSDAYKRTQVIDILNAGFTQLRCFKIEKLIIQSPEKIKKILIIQRFYKQRLLDRNQLIQSAINNSQLELDINNKGDDQVRGDKRLKEMLDLKAKLSLIEETTENSQAFQSCRPVYTPQKKQKQGTIDRDLLLDYGHLGVSLIQDHIVFDKVMAKKSMRQSPKPSPYTQIHKNKRIKNMRANKMRISQEQQVKNEFQINHTMMRTQRQQFSMINNDKKGGITNKKITQIMRGEQSNKSPIKSKQ